MFLSFSFLSPHLRSHGKFMARNGFGSLFYLFPKKKKISSDRESLSLCIKKFIFIVCWQHKLLAWKHRRRIDKLDAREEERFPLWPLMFLLCVRREREKVKKLRKFAFAYLKNLHRRHDRRGCSSSLLERKREVKALNSANKSATAH